jgi:DNA-binding beta-propeller fold protein YncE
MPLNRPPLSGEEYNTIKNWVAAGAPDNKGFVKFSDNDKRNKIYVVNQVCDEVTVFDSQSLLPMRYIHVGTKEFQEFPFHVKVAPNGEFWILSFYGLSVLQKFSTKHDKLLGEINLGVAGWQTFDISADSKTIYVAGNFLPGKLASINAENMTLNSIYTFSDTLKYTRGVLIDNTRNKLYVGNEVGNFIYVVDITDPQSPVVTEKSIDGSGIVQHTHSIDPHFFTKTSNNSFCFTGSEYSNSVAMIDMNNDSHVATFDLPAAPQQMDVYNEAHLLFISCPEDQTSFPGHRGSVIVIDYLSKSIVKKINTGFQPYGLVVDKSKKVVAVSNANLNSGGPAPHHSTGCGGRNGYVTFIDLSTLTLLDKKIEVAVFPRGMAVRK